MQYLCIYWYLLRHQGASTELRLSLNFTIIDQVVIHYCHTPYPYSPFSKSFKKSIVSTQNLPPISYPPSRHYQQNSPLEETRANFPTIELFIRCSGKWRTLCYFYYVKQQTHFQGYANHTKHREKKNNLLKFSTRNVHASEVLLWITSKSKTFSWLLRYF